MLKGGSPIFTASFIPTPNIKIGIISGMINIGNKIFAAGQAYTALSRARNLKSVKVIEVSPDSFITRKSVIKFYKKLENSDNKETDSNLEKEIIV